MNATTQDPPEWIKGRRIRRTRGSTGFEGCPGRYDRLRTLRVKGMPQTVRVEYIRNEFDFGRSVWVVILEFEEELEHAYASSTIQSRRNLLQTEYCRVYR